MGFKEIDHIQLSKNKDVLTEHLKALSKEEIREGDYAYSVEFSWDEFIVTAKAQILQRTSFTADAHIKLSNLSEDLTQVDVTIKFSDVTWIFLVFVQLGITVTCIFVAEFNWWGRIGMLIGISGAWYFIAWLTFTRNSSALKKVIRQLVKRSEETA